MNQKKIKLVFVKPRFIDVNKPAAYLIGVKSFIIDEIYSKISQNVNVYKIDKVNLSLTDTVSVKRNLNYNALAYNKSLTLDNHFMLQTTISGDYESIAFVSVLQFNIKLVIINPLTDSVLATENHSISIPIGMDIPFDLLDRVVSFDKYFNKGDLEVRSQLKAKINDLKFLQSSKIFCQPLQAIIKLVNNNLTINLGRTNGLMTSHLMYTSIWGKDRILEVQEVSEESAILTPFDETLSITNFVGKVVSVGES